MNETAINKLLYYRLIALWVLCEAMLGGIIHGLKLPVTGLFIGSGAVICISLIAYYIQAKGAIIKAMIIVCIFKMMLSPHAPPMAYAAVMFQGFMGEILFSKKNMHVVSCYLLAVIALAESAVQRILVLIIVYGTAFWEAVDISIAKLLNQEVKNGYSFYIATGYLLLHIIVGIWVGRICSRLPFQITGSEPVYTINTSEVGAGKSYEMKRGKSRMGIIIIWILLFILYLQSALNIGDPILPAHISIHIFLRSLLIILGWYLFLSPLLSKWIQRFLKHKQYKWKTDVDAVVAILPSVKSIIRQAWQHTSVLKGINRLTVTLKLIAVHIIKTG